MAAFQRRSKRKVLGIFLLLIGVFISASGFNIRSTPNDNLLPSVKEHDKYIQAICHDTDRCINNDCSSSSHRGCVCFNNGTCAIGDVNRCADCKDPDVFAVLEGHDCPDKYPGLCKPYLANENVYCPPSRYDACVCTVDGVCESQKANNCRDCKNSSVLAIFQGDCVYEYLQCRPSPTCQCGASNQGRNGCNYESAYKCTPSDRNQYCLKSTQKSCVCYKNGMCETTSTSRCIACSDDQVESVYEGAACPNECNAEGYGERPEL